MKIYLYLAHWNGGMPNKDPCYDTRRERESWMTGSILFSSIRMDRHQDVEDGLSLGR